MIKHTVNLLVSNARAADFFDFMTQPSDAAYNEWWPGTHLRFHLIKAGSTSHLADEVFFDEFCGKRRLTFRAVITEIEKPTKIVWQMKKFGLKLPGWVRLEMRDTPEGIQLSHETSMGFRGAGKLLDPLIRLYFNQDYQADLEAHCHTEWALLAKLIAGRNESQP